MKKYLPLVCLGVILFTLYFINESKPSNKIKVAFSGCIDGDTAYFNIDNNKTKVRFLGIDAMELNTLEGIRARDYTCSILEASDNIQLEKDPLATRDKFDRSLYWVFVDGELLEVDLLSKGYARVAYMYDDYLYKDDLYRAQDKAKLENLCIWEDTRNK